MWRRFNIFERMMIGAIALSSIGCQQNGSLPPPVSLSSISNSNSSNSESEVSTVDRDSSQWVPEIKSKSWKFIVVHHTASFHGDVESIHQIHLKRKDSKGNPWRGIGYHFVIGNGNGMSDGKIEPTFRWKEQLSGAHAGISEYNSQGIGICFIGNFEETSPTPAQLESARVLISYLKTNYFISTERVIGHRNVKATACPGRFFPLEEVAGSVDSN